jgi:hypothetical protein
VSRVPVKPCPGEIEDSMRRSAKQKPDSQNEISN